METAVKIAKQKKTGAIGGWDAIKYAKQRIADEKTPEGWPMQQCFKNFINDLKASKNKSFPYKFSNAHGNKIISLIELLFVEPSKDKPIKLFDWQKQYICILFGWREKATGKRRFKQSYLQIAKKNGKTTLAAMLIIIHLLLGDRKKKLAVSFATVERQGLISIIKAVDIIKASPMLKDSFKIKQRGHEIYMELTKSTARALTRSASAEEGIEPTLVLADELHHHKSFDMLNRMVASMVGVDDPLTLATSTAGTDLTNPAYQMYRQGIEALKDNKLRNKTLYYFFEIDEKDNWKNNKLWYKANPSIHGIVNESFLIDVRESINENAEEDIESFIALNTCRWSKTGATAFLQPEEYRRAFWQGAENIGKGSTDLYNYLVEEKRHLINYAGLDLSATNDLTAFSILSHHKKKHVFYSKTWLITCERKVKETEEVRNTSEVNLRPYVENGEILVCGGEKIEQSKVIKKIADINKALKITHLSYDNYASHEVILSLRSIYGIECKPAPRTQSISLRKFIDDIRGKNVLHGNGELMVHQVASARPIMDSYNHIKLLKKHNLNKIDGLISSILSINAYMEFEHPTALYQVVKDKPTENEEQ